MNSEAKEGPQEAGRVISPQGFHGGSLASARVHGSAALGGPLERCVLTAGNFDGLHLGHQSIVRTVTSRARVLRGVSAAYTFEPHPRRVLQPQSPLHLLLTLEQKLEHFAAAGLDVVIVEPFDRDFAALPAERFVREVIHGRIAPVEMYVGYDFRYGRDRAGFHAHPHRTGAAFGDWPSPLFPK